MEKTNKIQRLARVALTLYMLLLIWIIIFKCNMRAGVLDSKTYNGWFTLAERFEKYLFRFAKTTFVEGGVNILFFVPLGMLMPFLMRKYAYLKTMLFCFLISAGLEILQIIDCIGSFTYVDVINNTAGGVIGVLVYFGLHDKIKEGALTVIFKILIFLLIPILVFATVNTAIHIEWYL